jgi:protein associated with RNAse G/E
MASNEVNNSKVKYVDNHTDLKVIYDRNIKVLTEQNFKLV